MEAEKACTSPSKSHNYLAVANDVAAVIVCCTNCGHNFHISKQK